MNVEFPADEAVIVMTRTFHAPRHLVWKALTDPKHVSVWYGGIGFSSPACEMDVRPGGTWRHVMRTPDGTDFDLQFVYLEVVPPARLVWQNDPKKPLQPGLLAVTNVVTLEDAGSVTRWKMEARFASTRERDLARENGFARMVTQGSEKLDAIVRGLASPLVTRAVETFAFMLENLQRFAAKAPEAAREELVEAQLAPDMFPFRRQVQLACHYANDAVARLVGSEPPVIPDAKETWTELAERVASTLTTLRSPEVGRLEGSVTITLPLPDGAMQFVMSGEDYAYEWSLPHFYFHVVTAYDVLRHHGVPIGKMDYLGSAGRFLRPVDPDSLARRGAFAKEI